MGLDQTRFVFAELGVGQRRREFYSSFCLSGGVESVDVKGEARVESDDAEKLRVSSGRDVQRPITGVDGDLHVKAFDFER